MSVRVKICGLRTPEAVAAALEARADLVGFVFFPPSPRNIAIADAAPLTAYARGMAASVALTVDASDDLIGCIVAEVDPDMLQLHGSETPARVSEVRRRWGKPVMKAVKVGTAAEAEAALAYLGAADMILFDAKPPPGADRPGGHGLPFDWRALAGVRERVPFMLSGGLTPANVAEAIRLTGARAVDVSSGVERRPGEKDADLIRSFVAAAKGLAHAAASA
jgi:phosphoribosylanthranilate isomerase